LAKQPVVLASPFLRLLVFGAAFVSGWDRYTSQSTSIHRKAGPCTSSAVDHFGDAFHALVICREHSDYNVGKVDGAYSTDISDSGTAVDQHEVICPEPFVPYIFQSVAEIMTSEKGIPVELPQMICIVLVIPPSWNKI
jgi:hypothetical protein